MTLFIAGGVGGTLTTSPDGITWTSRTSAFGTSNIFAVAYSRSLNVFVAVGDSGKLATSPDGTTWTLRGSGFTGPLNGVAWSPDISLFTVVGGDGLGGPTSSYIATSPDGVTWTSRTVPNVYDKQGVCWSQSRNLFVIVGGHGSTASSPDGVTWTAGNPASTGVNTLKSVAWSPSLSIFVAVGTYNGFYSGDGVNWTDALFGTTAGDLSAVVWSPSLGKFMAVGSNNASATKLFSSTTGTGSWTNPSSGITASYLTSCAWSPSLTLLVIAAPGGKLSTSPDGITWTARTSGFGVNAISALASGQENVAPNAPTLNSPATGTTVDWGVTQRFGWTPSDPDVGDTQSKFDLQYRLGTGAWTAVSGATPNSFWDAVAGTFTAGNWEWQVRTYDALGLVGPWSASSFFTAASSPGIPSITAPTSGSTIGLTSATVTWSVPAQTDYEVRKVADNAGAPDTATVYYDSGLVTDATTRSVTVAFPVNTRWDHIQVRVKTAGLWSAWADDRVYVSWTPPAPPTTVATADPSTATIRVAITNPTPTGGQPVTTYNDVYVSSPLDPEYRAVSLVPPNSTWVWWTPGAGRPYTIRAESVGSNGTRASQVADTVVIDGGAPTFATSITIDGGTP